MANLLLLFILLPFTAFFTILLFPRVKERPITGIAISATAMHLAGALAFVLWWALHHAPVLDHKLFTVYESPEFEFFIDFYFDLTAAVFLLTGSILVFLVSIFSKYYMHREDGFLRFFAILLVFFGGYNLVVLSGNLETMFIGWELLGISSFLLIGFYRDRYLPVKNSLKVLSFYRLGDILLMLAMWMLHHLWHKNISFSAWNDVHAVDTIFAEHYAAAIFTAVAIILAAAIKSGQFPFFTWLPRAMEGPTTSSAIFYGSLSVHIGAFLLLRTWSFWGNEPVLQGVVLVIGLLTIILTTLIARVQSSVKTQIAYASIGQMGLIFIEIALGLHVLALVHFVGNAFLRTYQLLVSPSVLSYLVHDMFFYFRPRQQAPTGTWSHKIGNTIYLLSVKEWNFDRGLYNLFWRPFKVVGQVLRGVVSLPGAVIFIAIVLGSLFSLWEAQWSAMLYATGSLALVLYAFAGRGDARHAWLAAFAGQVLWVIAIIFNSEIAGHQIVMYLSGTLVSGAVGYYCLWAIYRMDQDINLGQYHGYVYEKPGFALCFLLACLGMAGFPITPTFIGIDLLFSHIETRQIGLIVFISLNFLLIELTILRIYARVFLGPHKKPDHPVAFRSS